MKVEKDLAVMELTAETEETGDKQDRSLQTSHVSERNMKTEW